MAGVKGKSGGPRKNAGGARPGAGRPKKVQPAEPKRSDAEPVVLGDRDMLQLLQDVALGRVVASTIQVRAAIAAVQYTHTKKGDGGKKEEKDAAAKKAAQGRFAPKAPPKLVVSNK